MKIIQYFSVFLVGITLLITACSTDTTENEVVAGSDVIKLSGISTLSTRNDGVNGATIYLKAFLSGAPSVYFYDTPITFAGGLSSVLKDVNFPGAEPTYPLENQTIYFFAFSGKAPDDHMILTAGHGSDYDAVLSNYGKGSGDTGVNIDHEEEGTPGSSLLPAEILQFRHVMTQLIVSVEVDQNEQPVPVDPVPQSVQFTIDNVVAQGRYAIRAPAPDPSSEGTAITASVSNSQKYTIQLGENYLVPTGEDLVGEQLRSLIIDDYTATEDDLKQFIIQPVSGRSDLKLLPGYSYNLTLTINRLKVTNIKLEPIPWQVREIEDNNVSYDPHILSLDLGTQYSNTGDDAVTKVVLHTTDGKIYVGEKADDQEGIKFVTLPSANVNQADLYTDKGVLLTTAVTTEYQNSTLTIPISAGGMTLETPSQPYSQNNPYMITTTVQFMNINKDLGGYYKQGVDVDLQTLNLIGSDRIFNGFGDFTGVYDGNGYYIASLDIVGGGLFNSNTGTLKNIRISSGTMDVSGQTYAGGICAINYGTIVACINEAMITKAENTVGGISGLNEVGGTIIGSINTGNILQGSIVGGICGENKNTNEGAIAACILTGMLNHQADKLGGICGISDTSGNYIIRRGFGLVGCAQRYLGGPELAVDTDGVNVFDSSAIEPAILRNGLHADGTEEDRIVNRLNDELQNTSWGNAYQFTINPTATGITWPMPVKKQ